MVESGSYPLFAVFHSGECADRAIHMLQKRGAKQLACSVIVTDGGTSTRDETGDKRLISWVERTAMVGIAVAGVVLTLFVVSGQMTALAAGIVFSMLLALSVAAHSGFRDVCGEVAQARRPKSFPLFLLTVSCEGRAELETVRGVLEASGAQAVSWTSLRLPQRRIMSPQPYRPERAGALAASMILF